jgi:SAM-dependent methyltransferase
MVHVKHLLPVQSKHYDRCLRIMNGLVADLPSRKILDWGGGSGPFASRLLDLGCRDVTLYDYLTPETETFPNLARATYVAAQDGSRLPFADDSFDVVVSLGVLEHVPFVSKSLEEVYRVLKPSGYFFVFAFPQRTAPLPVISGWLGRDPHPRKYSLRDLRIRLLDHGFYVRKAWRFYFLPKHLGGFPRWTQKLYSFFTPLIYLFDEIIARIPLLNLLCVSVECYAMKVPYMETLATFDDYLKKQSR